MAKNRFQDLILWEDDDFVVINKPPFIATLEDRAATDNILKMARAVMEHAQVCHRLDKETSGVLAIAKSPEAYRHLAMQFEARSVTKVYHAVTDGIHDFSNFEVTDRILKLSNGTVRIDRKGKEALTYFDTLRAYKQHTLIACRPVTGRMHQIRIHLAHHGASISGDSHYGGRPFYLSEIKRKYNLKRQTEEQPLIKRLALHAHSLTFATMDGKPVTVEAPYPKDFAVLLKQLEKNL